jgi:3-oxoacyl-[acyl-carrier protein] reductase
MESLKGKTALVTGGSRGIGEAIVRRFAQAGANVAFTYHSSAERAEAIAADCAAMGVKAIAYKSDAASFEQAGELIAAVQEEFGSIDAVVNNAGITKDNLLLRMSEEDWDVVINTNLKSVYNITKQVTRTLLKQRSGSIINITSIVGVIGQAGQGNYAASKAGIIGFTKSVAKELGSRGIRCNAVAPGFIETDMTDALPEATRETYFKQIPLGRFGKPEEIADCCLFLASDRSTYMSGQVLSVCGALNT